MSSLKLFPIRRKRSTSERAPLVAPPWYRSQLQIDCEKETPIELIVLLDDDKADGGHQQIFRCQCGTVPFVQDLHSVNIIVEASVQHAYDLTLLVAFENGTRTEYVGFF